MAKKKRAKPKPKLGPKPKVESYGYCPDCGAAVVARERRIDGSDTCANGCNFPSRLAMPEPPGGSVKKGEKRGKPSR